MKERQKEILSRHAEIMDAVYERINNVHKRSLHPAQIQVARDYFMRGQKVVMSQWGRNGGKTETVLYLANVAALLNDNFWVMIVCPQLKQGKKIYWHKKRLQNYAPPQYIKEISSTDMRVEMKNNSIITVEGCENYESIRGSKPNLVIYDEFQLHSEEFHLEVMEPNLVEKSSSLFIFGTPPRERSAYYVKFREELLQQIADGHADKSYYEFPASVNPVNDKTELARKREKLIKSGNEVIWFREYEGKLVFGGEGAVFPKWDPKVHFRPHNVTMAYLAGDKTKLKWYTICDPGTSTCFAVLFIAFNPYTQQVFFLDEIYEKDRNRTDTRAIWNRIVKKEQELYPGAPHRAWIRVYDEAAAWFQREVAANFKVGLIPSQKQRSDEETDISRLKMMMAQDGALTVSDRCYWFRWEVESFVTDEKGKYPDKNNHLIDCAKYFLQVSNWKLIESSDPDKIPDGSATTRATHVNTDEWADSVVDGSLNISAYDIYSEYFN